MIAFDWKPTGRRYGIALSQDAFDDIWAVTLWPELGWVIIKNRERMPFLMFPNRDAAKAHVEALISAEYE